MSEAFESNDTARMEAFSDGVFAIAITLLALGIKVPSGQDLGPSASLARALLGLWPHYLAFVTSFATILAMWVNHHRIFSFVERTDHSFLYWNGLLLLLITFLPFPTALVADFLVHAEAKVAGSVYAGTHASIAFAFQGLWHHASRDDRLLKPNVDRGQIEQITRQYRLRPLLYLTALAASFLSAGLSVAACLCLAVFLGFTGWPTGGGRLVPVAEGVGPPDGQSEPRAGETLDEVLDERREAGGTDDDER